jgi:hypothetical protein
LASSFISWKDKPGEQLHVGKGAEESMEKISDHLSKHAKPLSDEEFGYYLAGLIEADGYISDQLLEIALDEKDASLAYYIKARLGFGHVYKLKGKHSVRYLLRHSQGLKTILLLINGKFLSSNKIDQLLKNGYDKKYGIPILPPANFHINQNHFLAGFSDAVGSFDIATPKDASSRLGFRVRLRFCLGTPSQLRQQNYLTILQKVKSELGAGEACLHQNKVTGIYHYEASSFQSNFKTIAYFDHFHLNSSKYVDYFKWRKAYRIIQRGEHLSQKSAWSKPEAFGD